MFREKTCIDVGIWHNKNIVGAGSIDIYAKAYPDIPIIDYDEFKGRKINKIN